MPKLGRLLLVLLLFVPVLLNAADEKKKDANDPASTVSLGKSIGKAANTIITAATTDGQKLADSEVGRFTIFLVAWKTMGPKAMRMLFGLPLMWTLLVVWWWSYRRRCVRRAVPDEEAEDESGIRTYRLFEPDEDVCLAHGWILLAIIAVSFFVMFAGN